MAEVQSRPDPGERNANTYEGEGTVAMLATIVTWIGAVLGIVVLLAMACGGFVLDADESRRAQETAP